MMQFPEADGVQTERRADQRERLRQQEEQARAREEGTYDDEDGARWQQHNVTVGT